MIVLFFLIYVCTAQPVIFTTGVVTEPSSEAMGGLRICFCEQFTVPASTTWFIDIITAGFTCIGSSAIARVGIWQFDPTSETLIFGTGCPQQNTTACPAGVQELSWILTGCNISTETYVVCFDNLFAHVGDAMSINFGPTMSAANDLGIVDSDTSTCFSEQVLNQVARLKGITNLNFFGATEAPTPAPADRRTALALAGPRIRPRHNTRDKMRNGSNSSA